MAVSSINQSRHNHVDPPLTISNLEARRQPIDGQSRTIITEGIPGDARSIYRKKLGA